MSRGESGNRIGGRAIPRALMMVRLPVRARRVALATMIVVVVGLVMLIGAPVLGAEGDEAPDCLKCHAKVLRGHDVLGTGSAACRACHGAEMGTLHLANGETTFPLSEFLQLCSQCHQQRYRDWEAGTHGTPALQQQEGSEDGIAERAGCISCHEPHQPQVILTNITRPHPAPAPSPSPPSDVLAVLGGIILLLAIAVGVVIRKRGGQS